MVDDRKLNLPNGLPLVEEEVIPTGVQFQYSMVNAEFDFLGVVEGELGYIVKNGIGQFAYDLYIIQFDIGVERDDASM